MSVEDEYGQEDSGVVKDLRKQVKKQNDELAQLRAFQRQQTFKEAGLDLEKPYVKTLADSYSGEATAGAVIEWAKNQGLELPSSEPEKSSPPPPSERQQAQQRLNQMQQAGESVNTGGVIDHQAWMELAAEDESAARQMVADGKVEFPDHIAEQLKANYR